MREVAKVTGIERDLGFCVDAGSFWMSYVMVTAGGEMESQVGFCKNVSPTLLSLRMVHTEEENIYKDCNLFIYAKQDSFQNRLYHFTSLLRV